MSRLSTAESGDVHLEAEEANSYSSSTGAPARSCHLNISLDQLQELMKNHGKTSGSKIESEYGGVEQICARLHVVLEQGLETAADIELRRQVYGSNKITFKSSKSFFTLILESLKDPTLIMLEIAAVVSLGLSFYTAHDESDQVVSDENKQEKRNGMYEAAGIMISIVIIVLITSFNNYDKERQFRGLQNRLEQEQKTTVLRNGRIIDISVNDLVVGDICILKYGDVISADGILFQSNELRVDESSLTGESDLVFKSLGGDQMLFSGTNVMEGSGRMLVTAVGLNSQAGIIFSLMKGGKDDISDVSKSVLQQKLEDLALKIGKFGMIAAASTVLIMLLQFYFTSTTSSWVVFFKYSVKSCIIGITILVVAVPEGLPLAVTLSLAYSVKKMMDDNNLVRHLDACETMGNATTICSDKTGTLTANRMSATECFVAGIHYKSLSSRTLYLPEELRLLLSQNISLNSSFTSRIAMEENNQLKQYGNKTECALLAFGLNNLGSDYQNVRDEFATCDFHRVYPFNSTRKLMRTIIKLPNNKGFRLMAKGASEIILTKCSFLYGKNGKILKLQPSEKNRIINEIIKPMAGSGLRTICLSYLDYLYPVQDSKKLPCNCIRISKEPNWDDEESFENMTCLAFIGIEDPVRDDVPEAIRTCQKAGITVRMVTGDNIDTARSIAVKCGIIGKNNELQDHECVILDSNQFNALIRDQDGQVNQEQFDKVWPHLRVLARSTPSDKYILVKHIIKSTISPLREVVAVTGDGTNDAPALKIADVGFAMGISGTEVAKEASDIILTDDNFSSIVKSVIWGRNVYDSIAKFIQFQLTVNIVAVVISVLSALVIQDSPLKAVQMLWVNLIMDTLGSLALSTEKPSKALLLRRPYGRTKSLISGNMLKIIVGNVCYQLAVILTLLFYGNVLFDIDSGISKSTDSAPSTHFTLVFNVFVFMTLFNEINSRKINGERNVFQGLFSNWIFCTIFFVTSILQVAIVQFWGLFFSTVPLTLSQWMWCLAIGFSMLIWGQIVNSFTRKQRSYDWISSKTSLANGRQLSATSVLKAA